MHTRARAVALCLWVCEVLRCSGGHDKLIQGGVTEGNRSLGRLQRLAAAGEGVLTVMYCT